MFLLATEVLHAQAFEFGVKGGIRTSDDFTSTLPAESKRYIVGPMLEVRLPVRFSFEFDALYQRAGYSFNFDSLACCAAQTSRGRDNSWQFPMIAKYHIPAGPLHPYAGIGYAPRIIHGTVDTSGYIVNGNPAVFTAFNLHSKISYGVINGIVVSGGLDLRAKHTRISPEFRYVRWTSAYLAEADKIGDRLISNQNEYSVLLGISWP